MATDICAQCGATFTERDEYRRHFALEHPDQPFPFVRDTPDEEVAATDTPERASDIDRPVNIIEETMEEAPEGTPEGDAFG
jgi:hypothetical protein